MATTRQVRRLDSISRYQAMPRRPVYSRAAAPVPLPHQAQRVKLPNRRFKVVAAYVSALSIVAGALLAIPHLELAVRNAHLEAALANVTTQVFSVHKSAIDMNQMQQDLQAQVAAHPNLNISVDTIDLDSGKTAAAGNPAAFIGASTTKVITAVVFLKQVEDGRAKLTDDLGGYSAEFQLQQMVQQSNNDSWVLFNHRMGGDRLEAFAHSNGVASYDYDSNAVSAADDAQFLAKLYQGKLLNGEHTKLLLAYMQNTNNEQLIPSALPAGAKVYHKYGQLDGYLHDTAIIEYQGHTIALAIYTQGADGTDYQSRAGVIHQITKAAMANVSK